MWLLKEKYNGKISAKFKKDIKRLNKGELLDYVIGFKEFLGCRIDLSKKPLIPRPETEFWTAKAIEDVRIALAIKKSAEDVKSIVNRSWGHENYSLKVLDIFAGSGCVGVSIMANVPGVLCDFADIDKNNLKQIKVNLEKNLLGTDAKLIQSDIFKKIKNKYDYIFANPPYIPTKNKKKIQKSVLKYEPKKALFGGVDGMKFINKFLKDAKKHLNIGGRIFMEFDTPQKPKIEKLLKKYKYKDWIFGFDQYGKQRWVVVK